MDQPTKHLDFRELSVAERILLVEEIWESIVAEGKPIELTDEQKAELDRRMEDYRTSPEKFSNWDSIKQRLQSRK